MFAKGGGGGLKALADMPANNIIFFGRLPLLYIHFLLL